MLGEEISLRLVRDVDQIEELVGRAGATLFVPYAREGDAVPKDVRERWLSVIHSSLPAQGSYSSSHEVLGVPECRLHVVQVPQLPCAAMNV